MPNFLLMNVKKSIKELSLTEAQAVDLIRFIQQQVDVSPDDVYTALKNGG